MNNANVRRMRRKVFGKPHLSNRQQLKAADQATQLRMRAHLLLLTEHMAELGYVIEPAKSDTGLPASTIRLTVGVPADA